MITRRKLLMGAAAGLAVSVAASTITRLKQEQKEAGFGLATIKQEGATVEYDRVPMGDKARAIIHQGAREASGYTRPSRYSSKQRHVGRTRSTRPVPIHQ